MIDSGQYLSYVQERKETQEENPSLCGKTPSWNSSDSLETQTLKIQSGLYPELGFLPGSHTSRETCSAASAENVNRIGSNQATM